ncbi:MAG: hypothetical protein HY778_09500 [Betaproteobacteria bacterium]|nr:hypothetical protein [Betaproteobacteria bacterium]
MTVQSLVTRPYVRAVRARDLLAPLLDLAVCRYVGYVFFMSGLLKVETWSGTPFLFENEFEAPPLSPLAGAYLGTAAERVLPLFHGAGRISLDAWLCRRAGRDRLE